MISPLTLATSVQSISALIAVSDGILGPFVELLIQEYHTYRIVAESVPEETLGCIYNYIGTLFGRKSISQ